LMCASCSSALTHGGGSTTNRNSFRALVLGSAVDLLFSGLPSQARGPPGAALGRSRPLATVTLKPHAWQPASRLLALLTHLAHITAAGTPRVPAPLLLAESQSPIRQKSKLDGRCPAPTRAAARRPAARRPSHLCLAPPLARLPSAPHALSLPANIQPSPRVHSAPVYTLRPRAPPSLGLSSWLVRMPSSEVRRLNSGRSSRSRYSRSLRRRVTIAVSPRSDA